MKIIDKLVLTSFLAVFIISFLTIPDAAANHNICWLKASNDAVFVRVFDKDRDGNTINDGNYYRKYFLGEREIWQGTLKKGETKLIESSNGEVRYDYKASSAYRSYGENTALCDHDETIRLP